MRLVLGSVTTFQVVWQAAFKLHAIHTTSLPDTTRCGSSSFSGLPGPGLFGSVCPEELT